MNEARIKGVVQTDNPTIYEDGREADVLLDKHGRQVITTHHVREMVKTAIADISDGTTTSLTDGEAGYHLDLLYLTAANESDASVQIVLTNDGTTVHTLEIPGGGSIELNPNVPIPGAKDGGWSVSMEDVTGATGHIEALFIKNT